MKPHRVCKEVACWLCKEVACSAITRLRSTPFNQVGGREGGGGLAQQIDEPNQRHLLAFRSPRVRMRTSGCKVDSARAIATTAVEIENIQQRRGQRRNVNVDYTLHNKQQY